MSPLNIKASLFAILAAVFAGGGSIIPGSLGTAPDTNWKAAGIGSLVAAILAFCKRLMPSPAEASNFASLGFSSSQPEFKKKQRKGFGWSSLINAGLLIGTQLINGAPVKQSIIGGIAGAVIGGTAYATPRQDGYGDSVSTPESNR